MVSSATESVAALIFPEWVHKEGPDRFSGSPGLP
jgi:hypothetical protein